MDEEQGEMLLRISQQLQRAADRMDRIHHTGVELANNTIPHHAVQTTNVHNGSDKFRDFALWITATASVVAMMISIVVLFLYVDQGRKTDRMQDYWNVTLQYVPGLKDHLTEERKVENGNRNHPKAAN